MDLRGSSWTEASGSRVSNIPPDPFFGSSLKTEVDGRATIGAGAKAEAEATRAVRTMSLFCSFKWEKKQSVSFERKEVGGKQVSKQSFAAVKQLQLPFVFVNLVVDLGQSSPHHHLSTRSSCLPF